MVVERVSVTFLYEFDYLQRLVLRPCEYMNAFADGEILMMTNLVFHGFCVTFDLCA